MMDRPILFSAPMIRALLDGRKTQTRRILKPIKGLTLADMMRDGEKAGNVTRCARHQVQEPAWKTGDRLWVKERGWISPSKSAFLPFVGNELTQPEARVDPQGRPYETCVSIHMPRWASRITLHVTGVEIERLQAISEADAIAEGVEPDGYGGWKCYLPEPKQQDAWACPRESFRTLWQSINGPGSWADNPWVAAIRFRVVRANIDSAKARAA